MEDFTENDKQDILQSLEHLSCPTHNKKPAVDFENGQLNLKCCCDEYRQAVVPLVQEAIKPIMHRVIGKAIKNK